MKTREEIAELILSESEEFHKILPELLKTNPGEWVVFKNGKVIHFFKSQEEAYQNALEQFGSEEPFLIEQIIEPIIKTGSFCLELGTIRVG
jgi:DNA repair exonuclease SbcCD ATPase subunit